MSSKKKTVGRRDNDPTNERWEKARHRVEVVEIGKSRVYRMLDTSLLEFMRVRGQIDEDQYRYGMMFYQAWYHAGLPGAGAIDYSRVRVDTSMNVSANARALDAMTVWNNMVSSLGRVHCHPLVSMVLLEETPEEYGKKYCGQKSNKLARLCAITVLRNSLQALVELHSGE